MQSRMKWMNVGDLVPWKENPRKNELAVGPVAESIKELGFGAPILARKDGLHVIAGHTRLKAAKRIGLKKVPVVLLDVDERQAKKLALADNRLGEISSWDNDGLRALLEELDSDGEDIGVLGWSGSDIDKLFGEIDHSLMEWDDGDLESAEQIVVLLHTPFSSATRIRKMLEDAGMVYDLHLRFEDGGQKP